jgi:hypothetical protein
VAGIGFDLGLNGISEVGLLVADRRIRLNPLQSSLLENGADAFEFELHRASAAIR